MDSLIDSRGVPQAFIASSLPVWKGQSKPCGRVPVPCLNTSILAPSMSTPCWGSCLTASGPCSRMKIRAEKAFELMQRAIDGEAVNETAKVDMKLVKRSRQ